MSVIEVTQPAVEPVTYEATRDHLNLEHDDDTDIIQTYIRAARRYVENATHQILVQRTFDYTFDDWRSCSGKPYRGDYHIQQHYIPLPRNPVLSVTSITYTDISNSPMATVVPTTVYGLDAGATPGFVYLKYNETWPSNRGWTNDIALRFIAGYAGDSSSPIDYAANVPDDLKVAIKIVAADMYKNRESTTEMASYHNKTIDNLIEPHVLYRL